MTLLRVALVSIGIGAFAGLVWVYPTVMVGLLVVVSPIPHAIAYGILRGKSQGQRIAALDERRHAAGWWLLGSLVISILVVNVLIGRPLPIVPPWSQLLTGFGLLAGAIPAIVFLRRYFGSGFIDPAD